MFVYLTGSGKEAVTTQATSSCTSTQTSVAVVPTPTTLALGDTEKEIGFGKSSGGVSYFEKMMIRRLHTAPHSLLPTSHPTPHQHQPQMNISESEDESDEGEGVSPSQYNVFHTSYGSTGSEKTHNSKTLKPCSDPTIPIPRPASSVKIEEVKFEEGSNNTSSVAEVVAEDPSSAVKKSVPSTQRRPRERKGWALQKQGNTKRERNRQKASTTTASNSVNKRKELSLPTAQNFSQTVGRIFEPHTKHGSAARSEGRLADFFLSGVDALKEEGQNVEAEREKEDERKEGGKKGQRGTSRAQLPISATVWLPDNSVAPPDGDEPTDGSTYVEDTLDHLVYCIETDLPPPSTVFTRRDNTLHKPIGTISDTPESETEEEEEEEEEEFRDYFSECDELTSEGYGKDSEALEDLAWELQSLTSGRTTRCELGDVGEDGEHGGGWGWGEGEKGREELEAEMERAKTRFEIYQQELMQQDSD